MESEEITKLVDGVYKNILDKFNPGARHLITAGKGYLKALHGAASASRLFNEALAKIAMNAQQSGTGDIGAALLNVVSVYKEIQEQQMNILKAFYVDLLVPLETNLEKDTKVVQHEQKKFLQQHKVRMESYQKAMATMKKQRKKKSSPENTEKELRTLQILEDQKKKLDAFCEQSYKNAMTQERRRYGFVLERQCSIAKHWMAYHTTGRAVIDGSLDGWQEVAAAREVMPPTAYETHFTKRLERMKEEGGGQLKKSRSVDAPFGDMRSLHEPGHGNHHSSNSSHGIHSNGHRDRDRDHSHSHSNSNNNNNGHFSQNSLPRAKSDFNLTTASSNDNWDQRPVVKALYAYMPSGENQLPFEEGDRIAMVGNKAKGWQFGENLRTQMFGWFPIAYTNAEGAEKKTVERETSGGGGGGGGGSYENVQFQRSSGPRRYHEYGAEAEAGTEPEPEPEPALESDSTMTYRRRNNSAEESSPTRMFGDTINFRHQKKYHGGVSSGAMAPRPGPPPTLPAPVPSASRMLNTSQSFCSPNGGVPMAHERRTQKGQGPSQGQPQASHKQMNALSHVAADRNGSKQPAAKTSLHSSNDSGFANEPPPQPEIDYSDEEQTSRVPIRRRADTTSHPREVASWTLNRNFRNSVDGHIDSDRMEARVSGGGGGGKHGMRYDSMIASDDEILQASGSGIKRTKSFWKFGRNDDIMAGMSLWQHRDLVVAPNVNELRKASGQTNADRNEDDGQDQEQEQDKYQYGDQEQNHRDKNGTLTKSNSNHSGSSQHEKQRKESVTSMEMYEEEDDENIYGMSPMTAPAQQQRPPATATVAAAAMRSNFTPKSRMKIMKTIEIDIENPTEGERLSTIKRGQKEYRESTAAISRGSRDHEAGGGGGGAKKQHQQQQQSHEMSARNQATNGNGNGVQKKSKMEGGAKNGHQSTAQKQKQGQHQQHQQQQTHHHHQMRPNPMDLLHSTEDEGESDDNGTLKMSDVNNFFDDLPHDSSAAGLVMKTVKRKDILKQYYTSEDEESDADEDDAELEIKSTSSDPYDCIVINDHLVRKDDKQRRMQVHHQHNSSYQEHQLEFQTFRATTATATASTPQTKKSKTANGNGNGNGQSNGSAKAQSQKQSAEHDRSYGSSSNNTLTRNGGGGNSAMSTPTATILPRTRLMKSSNTTSMTLERTQHKRESGGGGGSSDKERHFSKTYGPWYDFWDPQDQQQQHHTLISQKSANNSKMK